MPSKLIKQLLGFGFLLLPTLILAQSIPNGGSITFDQIWSATEWATAWQSKVDVAALGVTIPTYPQTGTEIALSIVPTNYVYPAGYTLRYATNTTPGTTDMTAAIQDAVNVVGDSGGGIVTLPPGTLKASLVTIGYPNVWVQGNAWGTTICASSATSDVIDVTSASTTLSDFVINTCSGVTKSAGYFVNVIGAANYARVSHVNLFNFFNGFGHTGSAGATTVHYTDSALTTNVAGGIGVTIDTTSANSVDILLANLLITGPSSGSQLAAGLQITNAGDITLDHVSTVHGGTGLNVAPGTGQTVQALFVHDSFFDSGSGTGVQFGMTGSGSVQLAKLANVWSATNANGYVLSSNHAGSMLRAEFVNVTGANNAGGYGFLINDVGVTSTVVSNSCFGANLNGMGVGSTVTKFKFIGNVSGICGQFGANTNVGLSLPGSNDQFTIADNDFTNNTTAPAAITVPSGGVAGQSWFIKGNQGLITSSGGQVTLSSGSTTTTVNHGLAGLPRIQDVTISPNTTLGTAAQAWVSAVGTTQFTITTNAAPGAGVNVSWNARIWGN